jgi:hypothetical protein
LKKKIRRGWSQIFLHILHWLFTWSSLYNLPWSIPVLGCRWALLHNKHYNNGCSIVTI